jgi:hypothetical protein
MNGRRQWRLAAAALALAASACVRHARSSATATGDVVPADAAANAAPIELVVQNRYTLDVDVFVVSPGGERTRVGTVTALSNHTFSLRPASLPSGEVRLLADPIGGRGVARSGPISVMPGTTITFNIEPDLRLSNAVVR